MVINANTRPRKIKRKLPLKSIVDPELVSSPASASMLDDLLLPSQRDRVILSQLWDDHNNEARSELAPVILGISNQKKQHHITPGIRHKTYLQRLKENVSPLMFDLSTQSIIPMSIANNMSAVKEANQYTTLTELDDGATIVSEADYIHEEVTVQQQDIPVKESFTSDDSSDDEWINSAEDDAQEKVYQDIFDIMSVKPSITRRRKSPSLKASNAHDWLENATASFAPTKRQKIRRQKLRNKLEQPYIIKKKIKSVWYIE